MLKGNPRPLIPWNKSVRTRLLSISLLPMFLVTPLFGGVVIYNWSQRFDDLLIAKVNGELTIAHQYLASLKVRSFEYLQALGASAAFSDAQITGTLGALLEAERQKYGFDFLYLINPDGAIIMANALNAPAAPEKWPIVKSALDGGGGAEIDLFQVDELASISPQLVVQANIPLVPTKAAVPTNRTQETRGMVVHSAAPATAGQGALVAGVLLNQNLDFIDSINALVYPEASLTEGSLGTATLFLDDVRISTNVRLFEDVRALGTRVSKEVRAAVLDDGRTWLDRAFVVNDWYISGYEPLVDSFGTRIGMLYVGFLDSPYRAAKAQTLWLIAVGFLLLLGISVPLLLRLARGIFRPFEEMVSTISAVEAGNLSARTGLENTENEVSLVSAQLDTLLDNIQERDQRLREWADELEARVAARTRELSDANQRLEATTKQLVVSGKLAAIGEITASVAHEINNPVAVIQGNTDLIRESIGSASKALNAEFSLIYEQVHRINTLVNKLLQFARPEEYAGEEYAGSVDRHSPNTVITDTLPLVQYLLNKVEIEIDLQLMASNLVSLNRTDLQQVLINLIVNAIHAMPDGGALTISTADHKIEDQEGVLITIADTGVGMTPEVLSRMFDPFYTTKRAEGTGLGLSITHKLIARSGGQIWAESQLGKGSIFRVHLLKA